MEMVGKNEFQRCYSTIYEYNGCHFGSDNFGVGSYFEKHSTIFT